ncbi:MAG TPA: peptide chain release factor N(5)-glutamine methyltransferase [Steroidobacteraceae bacterium]|jgi:release factor glutamine methyltransferase|nr:peptide chain release factor N(5)-glutamine methyltransferase [Steroidobacteraceae bacterium]
MAENLTVEVLLARGRERLRALPSGPEPPTAGLDAELLLAHTLGVPRARLKSHPESAVDPQQARRFLELLGRRAGGEPLAYLTGRKGFWSLELTVTPAALIPRPETELLVERALALGPAGDARVADLGTGAGAIALALARERPRWRIVATDVAAPALALARTNAAALGLTGVEFRQGDWFEALTRERFDLLISNPPYVGARDPALRDPALAYEPRTALTPGEDALACLRILARGAAQHLAPGGWLLLEHGATQAADVTHELVLAGFTHVRSHRDLAGHERMTEGRR